MRPPPAGFLTSHPPFIGLHSPVIGRVDRIGHLVEIRRSLGLRESARRDVTSLVAQDGVGGTADLIVSTPDGPAAAAVLAMGRVTAAARVPTCFWADQSIPAAC